MDKDSVLNEIFDNDPLGLLNVKPKPSFARTPDERLLASFNEINAFVSKTGKEPHANIGNVTEFQLYSRLKSLREDDEKVEMLKAEDIHGLLPEVGKVGEPEEHYVPEQSKEITSIDDILGSDSLDILGKSDEGLFEFKHTPKDKAIPDYIATRKPCKDFDQFEDLFKQCQKDLKEEKRKLRPYKIEQQIDKGYFFVLKGVLLYIAEVGKKEADTTGRTNARLRCIFENGTESDLLLRSLAANLYKDGRRVTEHEDKLLEGFSNISDEDEEAGYIYVLKSKSQKAEIRNIPNLYKIGYSVTDVKERIKNAEKEPTYLMAPVEYIAGWKCYNMNPQKFEQLIHNFFGSSCLEIDVFDEKGRRHTPREWFLAPLNVIEEAVELIVSGQITKYRFDPNNNSIVDR